MLRGSALVAPKTRSWVHSAMGRIGQGNAARSISLRPGKLLVVHLDGVPRSVLEAAISTGQMPFLARLVNSGHHHMDTAFWGSPASTPAFQAGLLYGLRHPNLPAYHWWDRELGVELRMNAPSLAFKIEERMGRTASGSLLEDGGSSYLSLFRGRATNELTMTSLAHLTTLIPGLFGQISGVQAMGRQSTSRYVRELWRETRSAGSDSLRWVQAIGDRRHELQFMLNRFFLIQLAWGLAWNRALIDMVHGVPAIYLVFGNFDEVAHRRGPFSEQAARTLYPVDRVLEELYAMGRAVPQPYDLVIVTDHGHVDSVPFERRVGRRLKDYLLDPAPAPLSGEVERALLDGRAPMDLDSPFHQAPVVIESGNFAHVYLAKSASPLEARELLAWHRNVLARAVATPEIGIVALRRGEGAVAIIGGRVFTAAQLDQAPLDPEFSRAAVADLLEELPHMPTAGDLVLYGQATHRGGTVGFAWEFGSHGGLTAVETQSVVLWPAGGPLDLRGMGHVTQLHDKLSEVYRR